MGVNRWTVASLVLALASCAGCSTSKPDGCVTLGGDVAQAIVDGFTNSALAIRPSSGRGVQADSGVYYAAYRISVAGQDETGVWALDRIDPPGSIRSVDGFAKQFTRWPELAGANGSQSMQDALACLD